MYPDIDDSKHSKVSINTFLFFLEIPFSGLCLRIGQGKWERPWRFLNLITFCGFLKANNNKKILNPTAHTHKKGGKYHKNVYCRTRMCKFNGNFTSFYCDFSKAQEQPWLLKLSCMVPEQCPCREGKLGAGKMLQLLRSFPPQQAI